MTLLVHGVAWDGAASEGGSPALRMQSPEGHQTSVALSAGSALGLRVLAGLWCLGHVKVHGPGDRTHVTCPSASAAERGKQCGPCFARDDARLMHDFHRGGSVPAGLRAYLMQPHWLYVATFAGGTTKVGTASGARKWNRLAEQGALYASYVAHAEDGRVVRLLEDLVTSELGVVQQVRSAAKAAALLEPRPAVELSAINKQAAARVRELLDGVAISGFSTVDEQWQRPDFADALCEAELFKDGRRHAYPQAFDDGGHGLVVQALCGAVALVSLPADDGGLVEGSFVANLGGLKGRQIEFGPYVTDIPALQDALF
jgi:Protein of unknown function (DUF2797)